MKFLYILSGIASLTTAISIPRDSDCLGVVPVRGDTPNPAQRGVTPFRTIVNKGNLEACRQECFSASNAQCRAFSIRENRSGGACYLYDVDMTTKVKPNPTSTYVYYSLPAGVRGDVPENVAQHYRADTSKTKGNYVACRELCLGDGAKCKGFGFKDGGNCQLYDISLRGRVKAKSNGLYIQYYADCNGA